MKIESILAGVKVGRSHPVRIMGVINVSPESFYRGSISTREKSIARQAEMMQKEGADFLDVGAMSTAPYLATRISEEVEAQRLNRAVKIIRKACSCPISIDTSRMKPAEAGLEAGASIINDISGLNHTPGLAHLAARAQGLILMANPIGSPPRAPINPIADIKKLLKVSLRQALEAGVSRNRIVADPGIGFFRNTKLAWWRWDLQILQNLAQIETLAVPILIGLSRKSFIGHLLEESAPEKRLSGSLAATAIAIMNGASMVRTHDVQSTREASVISKSIRDIDTN